MNGDREIEANKKKENDIKGGDAVKISTARDGPKEFFKKLRENEEEGRYWKKKIIIESIKNCTNNLTKEKLTANDLSREDAR